jgi:enoyl-CoA hydratase/carnithine racemase
VAPADRLDAAVERFAAAILAGGPRAVRLQKALILDWEDMSATSAIAHGIDAFAEAYRTDEPHRMAMARLAEMRARRSLGEAARSFSAHSPSPAGGAGEDREAGGADC